MYILVRGAFTKAARVPNAAWAEGFEARNPALKTTCNGSLMKSM